MIDITGANLVKAAQHAYDLSHAQGMGYLHFQPGSLPEEDAKAIVERYKNDRHLALSMDYVKGRACKFSVYRKDDKLMIDDRWFDHSERDLHELLSRIRKDMS